MVTHQSEFVCHIKGIANIMVLVPRILVQRKGTSSRFKALIHKSGLFHIKTYVFYTYLIVFILFAILKNDFFA